MEAGIQALGKEGFKVLVTELDVDVLSRDGSNPYSAGIPTKVLAGQAKRYAELFAVFQRHRDLIPQVTFWGLEDGQSWLNDYPTKGRNNYPLLFDRKLQPKPAHAAVMEVLSKRVP
jgi:endo-1,4-beta-xylanase